MAISMYEACVPPMIQILQCQLGILHKAHAHAAAKNLPPSKLINARLSRDMPTLAGQIRLLANIAIRASTLLTGAENGPPEGALDSFDALKTRIAAVLAYLKGLQPEQFAGSETTIYQIPFRRSDVDLSGAEYLFHIALPSFHFHATMVVGILRMSGVELSRIDFLHPPD